MSWPNILIFFSPCAVFQFIPTTTAFFKSTFWIEIFSFCFNHLQTSWQVWSHQFNDPFSANDVVCYSVNLLLCAGHRKNSLKKKKLLDFEIQVANFHFMVLYYTTTIQILKQQHCYAIFGHTGLSIWGEINPFFFRLTDKKILFKGRRMHTE